MAVKSQQESHHGGFAGSQQGAFQDPEQPFLLSWPTRSPWDLGLGENAHGEQPML